MIILNIPAPIIFIKQNTAYTGKMTTAYCATSSVLAGLVPAIHVLLPP
jgi:hypothetical protein